jgi:hypothetical protein
MFKIVLVVISLVHVPGEDTPRIHSIMIEDQQNMEVCRTHEGMTPLKTKTLDGYVIASCIEHVVSQ